MSGRELKREAAMSDSERLTKLEMLVMHLEHDVQQMHQVLLAQQAEMARLRELISRLEARVEQAAEGPEIRDPEEERPPHY